MLESNVRTCYCGQQYDQDEQEDLDVCPLCFKEFVPCSHCGEMYLPGAEVCPSCVRDLWPEKNVGNQDEQENMYICPLCLTLYPPGVDVCTSCGSRVYRYEEDETIPF